ncbi:unnamed protein product [Parnassius mnemosyne]|uniref:Uncharacterized protein n=1 Tax=Parnassius mnemosyne TaxID=213953 RepID=A0AAV1KNN2_9NEOP
MEPVKLQAISCPESRSWRCLTPVPRKERKAVGPAPSPSLVVLIYRSIGLMRVRQYKVLAHSLEFTRKDLCLCIFVCSRVRRECDACVAIDACGRRRARRPVEGVARAADKIEVVAGCGWGRRARVRPLHALGRAAGMLASQRSQSCNEEGAFFGARALRRPRGKGSGSPPC